MTKYAGLINLDGKKAEDIVDGLKARFEDDKLSWLNCMSIGFDAASVNTGEHAGCGVKLAKLNPMMKSHKDIAHREASACGDATEAPDPWNNTNILPTLEGDMNSIVGGHNRSSKAQKKLRAICKTKMANLQSSSTMDV